MKSFLEWMEEEMEEIEPKCELCSQLKSAHPNGNWEEHQTALKVLPELKSLLARKAGSVKSEAKSKSSRENGKLGGRPKKAKAKRKLKQKTVRARARKARLQDLEQSAKNTAS